MICNIEWGMMKQMKINKKEEWYHISCVVGSKQFKIDLLTMEIDHIVPQKVKALKCSICFE